MNLLCVFLRPFAAIPFGLISVFQRFTIPGLQPRPFCFGVDSGQCPISAFSMSVFSFSPTAIHGYPRQIFFRDASRYSRTHAYAPTLRRSPFPRRLLPFQLSAFRFSPRVSPSISKGFKAFQSKSFTASLAQQTTPSAVHVPDSVSLSL
jgi:hypothetical protein